MPLHAPRFEPLPKRPDQPQGGSPRTDDAFMDWCRGTVDGWNDFAGRKLCNEWQLSNHLLKVFRGKEALGRTPNFNHKIRWLGIEYAKLPELFEAEAKAYLMRLFHKG